MTENEILEEIKQIDAELDELENKKYKLSIVQLAIKLIINGMYGAFGNPFFYFRNYNIAGSITMQGQDLIKYSISAVNHYFYRLWHKDEEVHAKLGIKTEDVEPITEQTAIYADTDSTYVNFDPMIKSVRGLNLNKEEQTDFCIKFVNERFAGYLDSAFEKYSNKYNTENRQEFKLETISNAGLWMGGKNYMLRAVYDGESGEYMIEPELVVKGIDAAKPSFPKYAREKISEVMLEILDKGHDIDIENYIIPQLVSFKKGFNQLSVDECCKNMNISKYDDWVETDKKLIIKDKMPIGARSALYHNYLIEKNDARKYNKIKQGDKVKMYKAKDKRPGYEQMDIFSYLPGQYPEEFAPDIDRDAQFHFVVVEPINKALAAMGMQSINVDLKREIQFERIKVRRNVEHDEIYPLYCVNMRNLEYVEVPEEISKVLYENKECPAELFAEYLNYAAKYEGDTKIVPKRELPGLLKREKKNKVKKQIKIATRKGLREIRDAHKEKLNELLGLKGDLESEIRVLNEKKKSLSAKKENKELKDELTSGLNERKSNLKSVKENLKFYQDIEKYCVERAREMNREKVGEAAMEMNAESSD